MRKRLYVPYADPSKCGWVAQFFPERSILALPVAGKPAIAYWLDECRRDGVDEVLVLDYEYDPQVVKFAGDGSRWSLKLTYHGFAEFSGVEAVRRRYSAFFADGEPEIVCGCRVAGREISSLLDWYELNFAVLEDPGEHVLPGYAARGGVVSGMHASIAASAKISGRAVIGDDTRIGENCRLEGGVLVGSGCLIADGAELSRTIVLDRTFVGRGIELVGKVVYAHRVIDPAAGNYADIEESAISSGTRGRPFTGAVEEEEFRSRRFTLLGDEATEAMLAKMLADISHEISMIHLPCLRGVYLGGGYGRGEGAAPLANDLDLFVLVDRAGEEEKRMVAAVLDAIAMPKALACGIHIDFCYPKDEAGYRRDESRLMMQELRRGKVTVFGDVAGLDFLRREPAFRLPAMEAVRLLVNRGMGLLFARNRGKSEEFVSRNINKAVLGAFDARLIAGGCYEWRLEERAKAIASPLYDKAVAYKAHGGGETASWGEARDLWMHAANEILERHGAELSEWKLRHAVRWIVRRRTLGELSSFAFDPLMRILLPLREKLANAPETGWIELSPELIKDWKVFN